MLVQSRSLLNSIFTSQNNKPIAHKRHALSVFASASTNPKIGVIGGGVIGLTCALRLLQRSPHAKVTLICSKLATETTSAGAAGLWKPYAISGTSPEKVNKWGTDTFQHYLEIFNSQDAATAGIFLCPAYELYHEPVPDPAWSTTVPSYRHLSSTDLAMYDPQKIYNYGFAYDTIIAEGRLYMQWLVAKIKSYTSRVTILTGCHVESLTDLSSYSDDFVAVINCAGLGARELVKDESLYPIRGHVLRVKAPWVRFHAEAEQRDSPDMPAYIIPNSDTVVLGGTKGHKGDEDLNPRKDDRDAILARCTAAVPSLAGAEVIDEWVGLRPGRPSVRLELERFDSNNSRERSSGDMPPFVVHNYGHGGSGLTLAWGCAGDSVELLAKQNII
ncbi:hypothetical protein Ndes2526B_g04395 [Nannochloris sp. 'desiccata']